ncbi:MULTISPECIES: hypothetical protein [Phnomibacter]|uniref:Uncharacterized protein n=1 Tax=Phnomibacter ginsenosidimutans TaxID=2676868 RepID=A0A6I6GSB6_9BACT|nr:hypothetical protein [Phnomibacter ginsenosidimutans]QGW28009.1 hypothetical protein GLV81_07765 [Phnomibacter ginsenosidimutans]
MIYLHDAVTFTHTLKPSTYTPKLYVSGSFRVLTFIADEIHPTATP